MLNHYFKISLRNLLKNKGYSFLNIGGLSVGIAVALIVGLWVNNEMSYDNYHSNYKNIAQVNQNSTRNDVTHTSSAMARPIEFILREEYGDKFKYVIMSSWTRERILSFNDNKIKKQGNFMQKNVGKMLGLKMRAGVINGLDDPNSILLSASMSQALFGAADPIGKVIKMDNTYDCKVTGVYEDLPNNTTFSNLSFIAPWSLYLTTSEWIRKMETVWDHSFQTFVQIADNQEMKEVSEIIKNIPSEHNENLSNTNTQVFLHPMKNWYLRSAWKNGIQTGGRIENVWLFRIIGGLVLLLACINFMNLSTARSEKRAKEIGIRKSIGSRKKQLVGQFLNESFLFVILSFIAAVFLVLIALPYFNQFAGTNINFPWNFAKFWILVTVFIFAITLVAGCYPAFYLSSFNPIKALKGTFKASKKASVPRKILVVTQFTVSITLIIATVLIFKQIQHSKNRPIGYDRNGLVQIPASTIEFANKYDVFRNAFKQSGAVSEMSGSHSPVTGVWSNNSGLMWENKPIDFQDSFGAIRISHDYGKSINWELLSGRDFSRDYSSDSSAIILNETAVDYMGLEDPVGKQVWTSGGSRYTIIGVVKDMLMQSPYQPVKQTYYIINKRNRYSFYNLRLNPSKNPHECISEIAAVFTKVLPNVPFSYQFIDDEYANKFKAEERIGKLSGVFTVLAIFISCLGLLGLASYVAEQRTKEIGIRKILGASGLGLWRLLTMDFIIMVMISALIASPIAYYMVDNWLLKYHYRINISWEVFIMTGVGVLLLTIATVSFQAIKLVIMNPVKSLKSE